MMNYQHFAKCTNMPIEVKMKYEALRKMKKRGGAESRQYWIESAKELGMVDAAPDNHVGASTTSSSASTSAAPADVVEGDGGELDEDESREEKRNHLKDAATSTAAGDEKDESRGGGVDEGHIMFSRLQ